MKIKLDLSESRPRCCAKCGKDMGWTIFRHHMGNDAQLSWYNGTIRRNYYKYLDCVFLCNRCHMIIHFIYLPAIRQWSDFTPRGAWKLRLELISICKLWLANKIENPQVTKEFKTQWQRSFSEWRKTRRVHLSPKGG